MENIYIYNRIKSIKNINFNTIIKYIIICFFSFICGGTNVFNIFSPFGVSFCSIFFNENILFYFTVLFSTLGRIFIGNNILNIKYIIGALIISLINFLIKKYFKKTINNKNYITQKSFFSALSILISGIITSFIYEIKTYIIITSLIESISIFIFSYIMIKGSITLKETPKRTILSDEETLTLLIVLSIFTMSFGNIEIWNIKIKISLYIIISLIGGYKLGASGGAFTGAFIGFILMICFEGNSETLSILTISGMISGLISKKGKIFVSISFFLISSIMNFYLNPELINISWFKTVIVSILIFCIIPEKTLQFIEKYNKLNDSKIENRYYMMLKEKIKHSLNECSTSFYTLSDTFYKLNKPEKTNISFTKNVIDDIGTTICKNCGLFSYCWEKNFQITYKGFFDTIKMIEKKIKICEYDFDNNIEKNCVKLQNIIIKINDNYEKYRSKIYWENKIKENREIVAEQLFSMGKIIDNIHKNINIEQIFREDIENEIKAYFDKINIRVEYINATQSNKGEIKIEFKLKELKYNNIINKQFFEETLKIINKITGKKMRRENTNNTYEFIYKESKKLNVLSSSAIFCKKGNTISGDNFTFLNLSDDEELIALSDGMGSGEFANKESFFAIELLEKFLKAGFESSISIKLINSALLLNSTKDSFTTLDICIIDKYKKTAEFIKTGSASSYILRGNKIFAIRQENLPIGIFSSTEIEKNNYDLYDGDIIIMITDGVEDIIEKDIEGDEKWLENIFSIFKSYNPKDIAEYILKETIKKSSGKINDDMTIVVSRIWESL